MKKTISKIIYILASLVMVISQLGFSQVFAETKKSNLSISVAKNEVKKYEEFSIDVKGSREELENFNLLIDSSFTETRKEIVSDIEQIIYLKGSNSGTFEISAKSENLLSNKLSITVIDVAKTNGIKSSETAVSSEESGINLPDSKDITSSSTSTSNTINDKNDSLESKASSGIVTIHYKSYPDGASIAPDEVLTGDVGDSWATMFKDFASNAGGDINKISTKWLKTDGDGVLDSNKLNATGQFTDLPQEVTYWYGNHGSNQLKTVYKYNDDTKKWEKWSKKLVHRGDKLRWNNSFTYLVDQGTGQNPETFDHSYQFLNFNDSLPNFVSDATNVQVLMTDDMNEELEVNPVIDSSNHSIQITQLPDLSEQYHIVITYETTVNQDAPVGEIMNTSTVHIKNTVTGETYGRYDDDYVYLSGSVILTKTDDTNGKVLPDAIFNLLDSNGQVIKNDLKTDANGKISLDDLDPGNYQFVETEAPTGYHLDTTPVPFNIENGQVNPVEVHMTNVLETGGVILTKTDATSGEALQGAVFELQDKSGQVLQSGLITDASGRLAIDQLAPGDYQLVETQAPTGYDLDATPVAFTIEKGQTEAVQVSMTNKLTPGGVVLTKTDATSGGVLQGAVFELQDKEGKELQSGLTTDVTGKIAVNELAPGDYQFIETQAPTGYDLNKTPVTFTIEKGQTEAVQVSMTNKLTPGGVVLTKTDATSGDVLQGAVFELQDKAGKELQSGLTTDVTGKIAVDELAPGDYQFIETQAPTGYDLDKTPVTFTIEKGQTEAVQVSMTNKLTPGGVVLTKTDATSGDVLQGAVFELQNKEGKELQSGLTTDVTGKIAVDELAPGDYQFIETQAPTGYDLDKTPVTFTIEREQTEAVQVSMTNKLTPGGVVLTKTDATSGGVLQGAVFELQDKAGKELQSGLTTDVTGKIAVDELTPGDYQFIETQAPTGYGLDKTPVTFTIEKGQTEAVQVSMTNKLTPGGVVLTKTDATSGDVLQGAVFELQDKAGKELQSGLTTDVTGKIAVDELAPGDYQFIETQAPTGYDLDKTPVTFTIEKGQTKAVQVSMTNKPTAGSVILNKIDSESGDKLVGAVFELRDNNDRIVLKDLTTNSNGRLAINNLRPGKYRLIEMKAPKGYILDSTPIDFVIKSNSSVQEKVTKSNKGKDRSVRVEKRDSRTKEVIEGAKFKLVDSSGNTLKKDLSTDKNGTIAIEGLKEGQYRLVETQAPAGYILDSTAINFKLDKNSSLIRLTKLNAHKAGHENSNYSSGSSKNPNTYSPKHYPKTGEQRGIWMTITGGIIILLISTAWILNRRKSSER